MLARYAPAAANRDGIEEGELASLITEALERRLRSWRPFPQPVRKPRASRKLPEPRPERPRQVRPTRTSCLRGHAFTPENTIRVRSAEAARSALSEQFGALLDGNAVETAPRNSAQDERPDLASMSQISG